MKERSAVRSSVWGIVCLVFAGLVDRTSQRPLCTSPTQCEDNSLSFQEERPQTYDYMRALDDPDVMKQLLEAIVIQHKSIVDTTGNAVDYEENSTRRPLIGLDGLDAGLLSSSTERPPALREAGQQTGMESQPKDDDDAASSEHENSTERPIIASKLPEATNDASPWEVTTIEPQQLVSPLAIKEYHFEATTIQPVHSAQPISSENSVGKVETATNAPPAAHKENDIQSHVAPTKFFKKKAKRPNPTKRPNTSPPAGSHAITQPMPVEKTIQPVVTAKDQEETGAIQLPARKDPIRITKPPATTAVMRVLAATSKRSDKKPINTIPKPVTRLGQRQPETFGQLQGPGITNPAENPVSVASNASNKPDDYLISVLASIADDDDTDEDDDDEATDGEQAKQEDVQDSSDEDEDDDSAEENEERENYDYDLDVGAAGDVISRVMEEVSALI